MRSVNKTTFSFLLLFILILTTATSVFASSTESNAISVIETPQVNNDTSLFSSPVEYGYFLVRPTPIGQNDSFTVNLNSSATSFILSKYLVYGISSGQQASIKWTITDNVTDNQVSIFTVGDRTSPTNFTISNLVAGRSYSVHWESLNGYKVAGGTYVTVDGYAYQVKQVPCYIG